MSVNVGIDDYKNNLKVNLYFYINNNVNSI